MHDGLAVGHIRQALAQGGELPRREPAVPGPLVTGRPMRDAAGVTPSAAPGWGRTGRQTRSRQPNLGPTRHPVRVSDVNPLPSGMRWPTT